MTLHEIADRINSNNTEHTSFIRISSQIAQFSSEITVSCPFVAFQRKIICGKLVLSCVHTKNAFIF